MESQKVSLDNFSSFSNLVGGYLNPKTQYEFFPEKFSLENLLDYATKREFPAGNRATLVSALRNQYEIDGIAIDSALSNSLDELGQEHVFTVVTGHQLCLFTGPLYFIIKILHIIKLADELNARPGKEKVVPVFWMATEDHDFAEINHAHIFNQTLTWDNDQGGKVGSYSTKSLLPTLDDLFNILGDSENANELKSIISAAYSEKDNLASATRKLVHSLFKNRGLIIIDGDDGSLKNQCVDIFTKEVEEKILFNEQNETIKHFPSDAKVQVNPREVNLFYLRENKRNLIETDGDAFVLKDDSSVRWSLNELKEEIERTPDNFSPNVVLRPVYQERILPNLCYVGGPAEIAYWLQLKSSFGAFGVPFPLLNLRNSILWLDKGKVKKMQKLDILVEDLFDTSSSVNKKLAGFEETDEELDNDINDINKAFDKMAVRIQEMDATMKPYILSESRKIEKQLEQLKARLLKAKKAKNEERVNSYWNLHEKVFPGGNLHERYDNFVPYFLKYGWSFFDHIYDNLDPFDPRLIVIEEN